jgi:ATP-dependent RNA helicase DDX51/DBP6
LGKKENQSKYRRIKQDEQEKESRKTRDDFHEISESELRDGFGYTAGLQDLAEVDSTLSVEAAGTEDGGNITKSKKEKRKKRPASAEAPLNAAPIDQMNSGAERALHGLDTLKRKKKKPDIAKDIVEVDSEVEMDAKNGDFRHKKLMGKREKSLKKAEKLVQSTTAESTGEIPELRPVEEIPAQIHDLIPLPQPDPVPEAPILPTASSFPPWLSSPIRVLPTATALFSELGIGDDVAEILQKRGFSEAFAVQAAVLPLLLPGKLNQPGDILVSAATGSGKTLAYVLPMIKDISRNQTTRLRGLIIMPTRELVTQAKDVCEICASAFSDGTQRRRVRIGTAVGNETLKAEQNMLMVQESLYDPLEYEKQQMRLNGKWDISDRESDEELICDDEALSALPDHVLYPVSKVDIMISTPGRLVEHIKSTPGFTLRNIKWLVVDEADKLLDQSFQQWLDVVMAGINGNGGSTRPRSLIRKVILSATMTRDIGLLNRLKLYRPKLVVLEGSKSMQESQQAQMLQAHVLPLLLLESGVKVEDENIKPLYLMELLRREDILSPSLLDDSSTSDFSEDDSSSEDNSSSRTPEHSVGEEMAQSESDAAQGVLIFTKSNESAVRLARLISLLAPPLSERIGTLTSTTPRTSRKSILRSFAGGKISILVASDLASRGLDLPDLAHVINYDIPTSLTSYVHRIGRTARAGKRGHAWTLYTAVEGRWFWNEIGRTQDIERSGGKVDRVNIKAEIFGEQQRKRYGEALETLGREARNRRG